jgi:threonine synthase
VVPLGKILLGKAVQVFVPGTKIAHVEGNFDAALKLSRREIEGPRSKNL